MGKLSEKIHTHRDSTGSVMPSGEGLRVLTAAVYRGRLPGVSCLAACTTFAKPPEQRHSGDGPYPCCPRPNCRTPRLYHIEGCVSVCHRLPSARQRHRWYHRRRRRGARRGRRRLPQRHYPRSGSLGPGCTASALRSFVANQPCSLS